MEKIEIKITTKSNVFIGGTPSEFVIGGVDMETITDFQNYPMIPASSVKGMMRRIVRDKVENNAPETVSIKKAYIEYVRELSRENDIQLKKVCNKLDEERLQKMKKRFLDTEEGATAEYLFGIGGFNQTPKLIFNDFRVYQSENLKPEDCFSLDSKNAITVDKEGKPEALPRRYKTIRPEIIFHGEIMLYQLEKLKLPDIKDFVETCLKEFNEGIYRIGGSGSRGYGRVQIDIL